MIKPINGHILIEPVVHESFIASGRDTYEEIGVVIDFDPAINPWAVEETGEEGTASPFIDVPRGVILKGDRVYFDSWMAAKFPNKEKEGTFYWLVKIEDIRAVEHD